jgi:uncharacterized protein
VNEPPPPWQVRVVGSGAVVAEHVTRADSFWTRFRGLMGRSGLLPGEGLYLPDNSIHMFFMRFPIDALFVGHPDASGKRVVVACRPALPPWRGLVLPVAGAVGVIELRAGTLAACGVEPGTGVSFEAAEG